MLEDQNGSIVRQVSKDLQSLKDKYFKSLYVKFFMNLMSLFAFFAMGTIFYSIYEGWGFDDIFFFMMVTISTVGYGYPDTFPTDDNSRLFTIFFIFFGSFVVFAGISDFIQSQLRIKSLVAKSNTVDVGFYRRRMIRNALAMIICILICTLFIMYNEDYTFITSLYFAVQTVTTVGYGDITLNHQSSRTFLIFYIVFSTVLLAFVVNNINSLAEQQVAMEELQEKLTKASDLQFLATLNNGQGRISESQFILSILEHIGTIDRERDITPWRKKFQELDADCDGVLTLHEIDALSHRASLASQSELEALKPIPTTMQTLRNDFGAIVRESLPSGWTLARGHEDLQSPILDSNGGSSRDTGTSSIHRSTMQQPGSARVSSTRPSIIEMRVE